MSNATCVETTCTVVPKWIRQCDATILITITVIGWIGNFLVCAAFCLSNKLRTKTNILVVNLAVADFLTCSTLPIVAWSLLVKTEDEAKAVDAPCAIVLVMTQSFIGCSILTLTLIALNRWMLISGHRTLYDNFCRYRVIFSAQLISWVFPCVVTISPLYFGIGQIGYDVWSHNCALIHNHPYSYHYKTILLSCMMPGPMVIIICCYWGVFKYVKSHNTKVQQSWPETSRIVSIVVSSFRMQTEGKTTKTRVLKHQIEITKNLFYVVVTFMICLTPYTLAEFFRASAVTVNQAKILVVLNSCLNPILYAVKHPHFRQVFKYIVLGKWNLIR